MKEIKYRVWDEERNEFHYWGFLNNEDAFTCFPNHLVKRSRTESEAYVAKDRQDVDLYVGDIVKWKSEHISLNPSIGKIAWNTDPESYIGPIIEEIQIGNFRFDNDDQYVWSLDFYSFDGQQFNWNQLEKIGDIHQEKKKEDKK